MESIEKGKGIIISTIVIILLFDFIIIAFRGLLGGRIVEGVIRFFLECLILFFLYKGHSWAKWVISILLILAGGLSLLTLLRGFSLIILLGVLYFIFGIALISSKDVNAYMDFKKGKLKVDSDASDYSL